MHDGAETSFCKYLVIEPSDIHKYETVNQNKTAGDLATNDRIIALSIGMLSGNV